MCNRRPGFTLMELLIAMTLVGVVGLSFAFLYTAAQRFLIQSINASDAQGEASFAVEHVKKRLLAATSITYPPVGSQPIDDLTFVVPGVVGQNEYRYDSTNRTAIYAPAGGGQEVIARNVTLFEFERPSAARVIVRISTETTSGGDTRRFSMETTVSPRGMQN